MLRNPLLEWELLRLPRRRRFFALRFALGLALLAVVGFHYWVFQSQRLFAGNSDSAGLSLHELSLFGRTLFLTVLSIQALLVLGLAPLLVADALASERRRKTLHFLLSSRLSGREIVVGKLSAWLIDLGVFSLVCLPVVSLLTFVGGIDPEELLWFYVTLASSTFFLAGLAIWVAVEIGRPRDAIGVVYILALLWVSLPEWGHAILSAFPRTSSAIGPAFDFVTSWLWPASPFTMLWAIVENAFVGSTALQDQALWVFGSQTAYAILFTVLAAQRLRPAFLALEGRAEGASRKRGVRRRRYSLPPCGDAPIYWKETAFARSRRGIVRRWWRPLLLLLFLAYIVITLRGPFGNPFHELLLYGYRFIDNPSYVSRAEFNSSLRFGGGVLFAIWMLWLAQILAASLASEREQDTWISLLSTPLEGKEILLGKMLGALRTTRSVGIALLLLWVIGLLAGAVHPLGFLCALTLVAIYAWFVVAMATFISSRASTTWRAQAATQSILIALNCCCLISPPFMVAYSLLSYADTAGLAEEVARVLQQPSLLAMISLCLGTVVLYGVAAYGLTVRLFRHFDALADRPRRSAQLNPHGRRTEVG